jgi:hypothetical protein
LIGASRIALVAHSTGIGRRRCAMLGEGAACPHLRDPIDNHGLIKHNSKPNACNLTSLNTEVDIWRKLCNAGKSFYSYRFLCEHHAALSLSALASL